MNKRYKNKTTLSITAMLLVTLNGYGQNLSFANYPEAQIMYNPAMLSSLCRAQAVLNYRNSKFTSNISNVSTMLNLQMPLAIYAEKFNLGTAALSVFDDRSNHAPSVRTTGIAFAYSQPVRLTQHSFISVGLQGNYYQKKLDINSFTTGSQWDDNLGFDPAANNGETNFNERLNRFNLHSGIYWQLNNSNNKPKAFAGASLYNITKPNESFAGQENRQHWRYFINGGYTIAENGLGNLMIDAAWLRQEHHNTAGLGLKTGIYYNTSSPGTGEINIYFRYLSNNTLMMGAMMEKNRIALGISYDFLTARTENTGSRSNAFEAFLKIRFGRTLKNKITGTNATTPNTAYQAGQKRVFAEERKTEVIESSTPDAVALKKVETASDTSNANYTPMKLALKRDFKFAFNDATLNVEAKTYLDELVVLMNRNKNITIEIAGHTDDVGSKEGNYTISLRRAQIVADYLVSKGIDQKRISAVGKMDSEPLFPNTTPENRAKNRRVEFIILN